VDSIPLLLLSSPRIKPCHCLLSKPPPTIHSYAHRHTTDTRCTHLTQTSQSIIITTHSRLCLVTSQTDILQTDTQTDRLTRFPCCWLHCRAIKIVKSGCWPGALIVIDIIIHTCETCCVDSPLFLRGLGLQLQGCGDLMEEVAPSIYQSINVINRHWV
jgi:hypothetical protein